MEKEVYLANPCKASSLPFWKTNLIKISENMKIVLEEDLWIAVKEREKNTIVASGIAEADVDIKEGILEWIQVSPDCRGRGLGKFVVNELLWRMKNKVDFVTVSGKIDNSTNPRGLYLACGFSKEQIWHVLKSIVI